MSDTTLSMPLQDAGAVLGEALLRQFKVGRIVNQRQHLVRRDVAARDARLKGTRREDRPEGPLLLRKLPKAHLVAADPNAFRVSEPHGGTGSRPYLDQRDSLALVLELVHREIDARRQQEGE